MPEKTLLSAMLEPTGDRLLTPPLVDLGNSTYRIVLEGVFSFAHTGESFDAVYQTAADGAFSRRHDVLRWSPDKPFLEHEDIARHRYVFRIPAGWRSEGLSIGVRVDLDRFVEVYLISPGEVREALSGTLQLTLLQAPVAAPPPISALGWRWWAAVGLPTAVVVGGLGIVLRRRMTYGGLSGDLQFRLGQIEQKCRLARKAMRRQPSGRFALEDRLEEVGRGAAALVRQMQHLRIARGILDQEQILREVLILQRQLELLTNEAARQEGEQALEEKRKALALLHSLDNAELTSTMRLTKIEAVLDTTCLTLQQRSSAVGPAPVEETLRRELDAEVAAIREVERDLAATEYDRRQEFRLHTGNTC